MLGFLAPRALKVIVDSSVSRSPRVTVASGFLAGFLGTDRPFELERSFVSRSVHTRMYGRAPGRADLGRRAVFPETAAGCATASIDILKSIRFSTVNAAGNPRPLASSQTVP